MSARVIETITKYIVCLSIYLSLVNYNDYFVCHTEITDMTYIYSVYIR